MARLKNSSYEEIVRELEKELKLKGLEAPDELQESTVSHYTANLKADRPKLTFHHFKGPGNFGNHCRQQKKQKKKTS